MNNNPKEKEKDNFKKKRVLVALSVLFLLIVPAILVILSSRWLVGTWVKPEVIDEEGISEYVSPSKVLNNKLKYKDQFLIVRGQVVAESAVCQRRDCPKEDPCCGCDNERDLVIADSGTSVVAQSPGRLRLLTPSKGSFCYRKENSCDYDCAGWKSGGLYKVKGIFKATPPPQGSGWKLYFDYYFEVHEKELVRSLGIFEKAKALFNDFGKLIQAGKKSTYYILR